MTHESLNHIERLIVKQSKTIADLEEERIEARANGDSVEVQKVEDQIALFSYLQRVLFRIQDGDINYKREAERP